MDAHPGLLDMLGDPGLLDMLGIRVSAAFAGLAGGVVGAWADGKSGFLTWCSYCGAGLITGNFLALPATHVIPLVNEGGAGFLVGCCALAVVRAFIGAARKWAPQLMNGGKSP